MKKKYLIAGAITFAITASVIILLTVLPAFFDSLSVFKYEVDISKDIVLDFKDANISYTEWGKNYIEVTYDNVFGKKIDLDITSEGNVLTLKSKLDFSAFRHISINAPKAVVSITANMIQAKSGTFRSIKANKAILRYCTLAEGFNSTGKLLAIRESSFKGDATIKSESVNVRECEINDLVLTPDNPKQIINAELRELSGKSVWLNANTGKNLSVLLRDSELNRFTVDYSADNGDVTILRGSVKEVENNSKLKIKIKKNIFK